MKELICPLCTLPLHENSQGIACINRHQFDRAKEGYFNLLPVQQKNSLEPGDAKQQLIARRNFLSAGYFFPLVEQLKKIISADETSLLDIGCGEGYFTRLLSEHCSKADVYGIDISKAGVRLAAKGHSSKTDFAKITPTKITYAVASSHLLPIADESIDVLTRIYAPSEDNELHRVLKPEGKLIIVTPGEQHLIQLREKIYKIIRPHPLLTTPEKFYESAHYSVSFPLSVPSGDLTASLLNMTPFAWKLSEELKNTCMKEGLKVTAHFHINVFEKS